MLTPVQRLYMPSKLVASGLSGLPNSSPSKASVLALFTFCWISFGSSSKLILLPSSSADLDILLVPS